MTTRQINRIASLERSMTTKEGVADAIRRAYREMVNGLVSVGEIGGRIANDILKARAERQGSRQ